MSNKGKAERRQGSSPKCIDIPARFTDADAGRKRLPGTSVKQLVRSLSNRYASVTSPLSRRKNTRPSSSASLKTMKTTAATNLLPLNQSVASRRQKLSELQGNTPGIVLKRSLDTQERPTPLHSQPSQQEKTTHASILRPGMSPQVQGIPFKDNKPNPLADRAPGRSLLLEKHSLKAPTSRDALSQVLRSEQRGTGRNKENERHVQQLGPLFTRNDEELENTRSAGLTLKELRLKQDEEIKTLKAAFPATLKENDHLRELCERQEKELTQARVTIPVLQEQVYALAQQLKSLAEDVEQVKACRLVRQDEKVSQLQGAEATGSNCSGSTLTTEPSPMSIEQDNHFKTSRRGLNYCPPAEEKLSARVPTPPATECEAASSSSCSASAVTLDSFEVPSSNRPALGRHRRGLSAVLSGEHMLAGGGKRSGRRSWTDKEITETLQELNSVADREQALLQERCNNVFKDLRSSSSRFASLESLKSILTCTSPHFCRDDLENEGIGVATKLGNMAVHMWNLKPT